MPFYYSFVPIRTNVLPDQSFTLQAVHGQFFNFATVTALRVLTVDSAVSYPSDCEIIIRNSADSSSDIDVSVAGAFLLDVSSDLGNTIPAGGIAQIKRIGATNRWVMYGFIE